MGYLLCCAKSVMSDSATPWTVAHQVPLSTGILQARILEWVAMSSSRGSSQPRDRTQVSALQADSLPSEPPGKPMILKWVAYPFCRRTSWPRNQTRVSSITGRFFTSWVIREAQKGMLPPHQGIELWSPTWQEGILITILKRKVVGYLLVQPQIAISRLCNTNDPPSRTKVPLVESRHASTSYNWCSSTASEGLQWRPNTMWHAWRAPGRQPAGSEWGGPWVPKAFRFMDAQQVLN